MRSPKSLQCSNATTFSILNPKTTQLQLKKLFKIQNSGSEVFAEAAKALYESTQKNAGQHHQRRDVAGFKNIDRYFDQDDYKREADSSNTSFYEAISPEEVRLPTAQIHAEVEMLRDLEKVQCYDNHRLEKAKSIKSETQQAIEQLSVPRTSSTRKFTGKIALNERLLQSKLLLNMLRPEQKQSQDFKTRAGTSTTCQTRRIDSGAPSMKPMPSSIEVDNRPGSYLLLKNSNRASRPGIKVFQRQNQNPTQTTAGSDSNSTQNLQHQESNVLSDLKVRGVGSLRSGSPPMNHKILAPKRFMISSQRNSPPRHQFLTSPSEEIRIASSLPAKQLYRPASTQVAATSHRQPVTPRATSPPLDPAITAPNTLMTAAVTGIGLTEEQIRAVCEVFAKNFEAPGAKPTLTNLSDEEVVLACTNQGVNLHSFDLSQRDYIQKFFKCLYGARALNKMKLIKPFVYPCSFRKEDINTYRLLTNIPDGEGMGTMNITDIWESGMRHACLKQAGLVKIKKHLDQVANSSKAVVSLLNKNLNAFLQSLAQAELEQTRIPEHSRASTLSFGRFLKNYQRHTDEIGSKTLKQTPFYQQNRPDVSILESPQANNTLLQLSYSQEISTPAQNLSRPEYKAVPLRSILKQRSIMLDRLDTSQQSAGLMKMLSQELLD